MKYTYDTLLFLERATRFFNVPVVNNRYTELQLESYSEFISLLRGRTEEEEEDEEFLRTSHSSSLSSYSFSDTPPLELESPRYLHSACVRRLSK